MALNNTLSLSSNFSLNNQSVGDSADYHASNIYTNVNGLTGLKAQARADQEKALPEVARQFESVFIAMMIKSMRQTTMDDSLFNSSTTDTLRGMYDQQLAIELSKGDGIGIAESIVRQLKQNLTKDPEEIAQSLAGKNLKLPQARAFPDFYGGNTLPLDTAAGHLDAVANISQAEMLNKALMQIQSQNKQDAWEKTQATENDNTPETAEAKNINTNESGQIIDRNLEFDSPQDFVNQLWPFAEKAAAKLGVKPEVLLSQAALETGWGKAIIKNSEGSSFNLFNIKADKRWDGDKIAKVSLEYEKGTAVNRKSYFRSYENLQQSFDDYVKFIQNNPRYQKALEYVDDSERYLHGIQKAGYATDPEYANKILRVMKSDTIQQNIKQNSLVSTKT